MEKIILDPSEVFLLTEGLKRVSDELEKGKSLPGSDISENQVVALKRKILASAWNKIQALRPDLEEFTRTGNVQYIYWEVRPFFGKKPEGGVLSLVEHKH